MQIKRFSIFFLLFAALLLQLPLTAAAQESCCKAYRKLSKPEKQWARRHLFLARKAWKITNEARQKTREMAKDTLIDHDPSGGQLDAFLHAYWMARLAQRISPKKALALGIAHEKGNYLSFLKGEEENGVLPDSVSSAMDLWNNKIGIQLGTWYPKMPVDSLVTVILDNIYDGRLRVIYKNENGEALRCNGFPAGDPDRGKRWEVPKCLMPSNYRQAVKR